MTHLRKLLIGACLLGYVTTIIAQNTSSASGGNASGSGGTASYSVGQVVYTTNIGTNGSVSQGVQQPFEISAITGLEEAKDITIEMEVYPNPVADFIKLSIMNYELQSLRCRLYDIKGNLLRDNKVEDNETSISMQDCLPATYILKITDDKKELKTFKIIKH